MKKTILASIAFLVSVSAFGQQPPSDAVPVTQDSTHPVLVSKFQGYTVQTVDGSKCPEGTEAIGGTLHHSLNSSITSLQTDCVDHKALEKI